MSASVIGCTAEHLAAPPGSTMLDLDLPDLLGACLAADF